MNIHIYADTYRTCGMRPYRHESIQQARVRLGRGLEPLHRPLLDDGRHLRVFCVEDAETRHVDATKAIRFHVESEQVLEAQLE